MSFHTNNEDFDENLIRKDSILNERAFTPSLSFEQMTPGIFGSTDNTGIGFDVNPATKKAELTFDNSIINYLSTLSYVGTFDDDPGTHGAVDGNTTKSSPGTVDAWLKFDINGTDYYVPAYTSKTS